MLCFPKTSLVFVLIVYFHTVNSRCRQSYATICNTFEDFNALNDTENISDLIIGSEDGLTDKISVDLMKTLQLNKFYKLRTLTILRAIDGLKNTKEFYNCRYAGLNLQHIILYGNVLKTIGLRQFPDLDPLKRLSLVNNQIESLETYAFTSNAVEIFDLSDNFLEVIQDTVFPVARKVTKVITLKNNKLTHIEPGSLPPTLEMLNLDRNRLRYVQDGVLEPLTNLKEFTLSHNNLNELPKVDHLINLVKFDISYNSITNVKKGTFKDIRILQFVDLSNNRILDSSVFKSIYTPGTQRDLVVSFAFNRLMELDVEGVDFNDRYNDQKLVLYGNPWDCNKWNDMKAKLGGHESQCDKNFFVGAEVPYCLNYSTADVRPGFVRAGWYDIYIDRLHSVVKKKEKIVGCVLKEQKYESLFFLGFHYCG